jgi:hypothetical protein
MDLQWAWRNQQPGSQVGLERDGHDGSPVGLEGVQRKIVKMDIERE